MSNVVTLNRRPDRATRNELGFYVYVGHNDHRAVLNLLASGEAGVFGFVVSAAHAERHKDLIADARDRGFDVILDPKIQEMATPGGFVPSIRSLPWASDEFHRLPDFLGSNGERIVSSLVQFAVENRFTQLIGPSHLISGPNDLWIRSDVRSMRLAHDEISASGSQMQLIYSLSLPVSVFRDRSLRQALIPAVSDVPCDAIWLKIDNFGDDASGEKAAAFLEGCSDFHALGVPVIADHVGGLPGLASLAFGAVGGIAHGIAVCQNFKANALKRPLPEVSSGFAPPEKRVYIPQLDSMLSQDAARQLLHSSTRARGHFACNDQRCCPRGVQDMLSNPGRHALFRRAREIERIASYPISIRAESFVDQTVRPVSDDLARVAGFASLPDEIRRKFGKKQTQVSGFRAALTHILENPAVSVSVLPRRRSNS
jgi:hypothetical protein